MTTNNPTSKVTELPAFSGEDGSTIHCGRSSKYDRFCGTYFANTDFDKHIVVNVTYQPDKLYQVLDGMAGRCWMVVTQYITDLTFSNYYIRNWEDIVHYYDDRGYKFVCPAEARCKN